ncbi:MAG TPA: NAD(P)H-binding protein [Candidatus Binataceae bacterium]|nr:NAD(P)H-binding protein [Candidatus Binataceae bacterium]
MKAAIAGGSGFIGSAIARRMAAAGNLEVRILSRNPEAARKRMNLPGIEFVRGDVTEPATLVPAIAGADVIVAAMQFDGYPVENSRRGLTFERVDYAGTVALIDAAKKAGARHFIYISGAASDETSSHPAFRAKGRTERAVRESGLTYTIFRPSLVYGPGGMAITMFVRMLRFAPVFGVPGTGKQKVQPVLVDDLAQCVTMAAQGRGRNGVYDIGGPDLMTFDDMMRVIMDATGYRRPLFHIPAGLMRAIGAVAGMLPNPVFSRDAVTFVTADNACDIAPLVAEFGIKLTPMREGLAYLSRN